MDSVLWFRSEWGLLIIYTHDENYRDLLRSIHPITRCLFEGTLQVTFHANRIGIVTWSGTGLV